MSENWRVIGKQCVPTSHQERSLSPTVIANNSMRKQLLILREKNDVPRNYLLKFLVPDKQDVAGPHRRQHAAAGNTDPHLPKEVHNVGNQSASDGTTRHDCRSGRHVIR
jgi:hypothetical protein